MNQLPKIKTPRDSKFLKFVRDLPCIKCGNYPAGQSHHTETGGVSPVGSDYSAVPLCYRCHHLLHTTCSKSGFWQEEELKAVLNKLREQYEQSKAR